MSYNVSTSPPMSRGRAWRVTRQASLLCSGDHARLADVSFLVCFSVHIAFLASFGRKRLTEGNSALNATQELRRGIEPIVESPNQKPRGLRLCDPNAVTAIVEQHKFPLDRWVLSRHEIREVLCIVGFHAQQRRPRLYGRICFTDLRWQHRYRRYFVCPRPLFNGLVLFDINL